MGGNAVHTGHNSGHKSGTSVFMVLLVFPNTICVFGILLLH